MSDSVVPIQKGRGARDRILVTAHNLFYREGIRATGINRLISEAKVTKTTFYRHFRSKNDLIYAFLEYRHQNFMDMFAQGLDANGGDIEALFPTLEAWFKKEGFRGCAFLNSISEVGGSLPKVAEITRRHKQEIADVIEPLLPPTPRRSEIAMAIVLAIDGAIVRAQYDKAPDTALILLRLIVESQCR